METFCVEDLFLIKGSTLILQHWKLFSLLSAEVSSWILWTEPISIGAWIRTWKKSCLPYFSFFPAEFKFFKVISGSPLTHISSWAGLRLTIAENPEIQSAYLIMLNSDVCNQVFNTRSTCWYSEQQSKNFTKLQMTYRYRLVLLWVSAFSTVINESK